jgi:hypothetical protein
MQLSREANALLAELWRCHEHNPINHFEYLVMENGQWGLVHPASRRRLPVEPAVLEELIRAGLLHGRTQLSFTSAGMRYCQWRRGAG